MQRVSIYLTSFIGALLLLVGCQEEPPVAVDNPARSLQGAQAEVSAEEEILGGLYEDGSPVTSTATWVRLVPIGSGAKLVDSNGNPATSDRMPLKPLGSRHPAKTTPDGMWGWYDPEAGDGPCSVSPLSTREVHDLNLNNLPDGDEGNNPIEQHCAPAGAYEVQLLSSEFGSVLERRTIDKVRAIGGGRQINNKAVEHPDGVSNPGPNNVVDNFVHFDRGESASSFTVSGTYTIDADTTEPGADSTGAVNKPFFFDAQHTTTWNGTTRGELQVEYDYGDFTSARSSNTDMVVRTHVYDDEGPFDVFADVEHPGGTGVQGQQRTAIVTAPANEADAVSHTLPANIEPFEVVATSVTMKNTGTDAWGTSTHALDQVSDPDLWSPLSVSLSSGVASGNSHTFNFNIRTFEPEFAGTSQENFWQMETGGQVFGDVNGRFTFIEEGSGQSASLLESMLAHLRPRSAFAASPFSAAYQGEVVQTMRVSDFPVNTDELKATGVTHIRYRASLAESWDVDFEFRIRFDPAIVSIGTVVPGPKARDLALNALRAQTGREYSIQATRTAGKGIAAGDGLILEIPIVLRPGASAPESLPLVELITTR